MNGLYIASTDPWAGKSLLSFSLGILLQEKGYSVAYMKPLGAYPKKHEGRDGDADALLIQEILGQQAPADLLSPVIIPSSLHTLSLVSCIKKDLSPLEGIKKAYQILSQDKDLSIVCGTSSFPDTGTFCGADGLSIVKSLNLKTIIIDRFKQAFRYDFILKIKEMLGESLLGVVFNDVPEKHRMECEEILKPVLESRGVEVLGIIPHEVGLEGIRASELAHSLGGFIAAGNSKASRIVKGYVVGTMQVDNFMNFLRQKAPESVVIVGGDRADLQFAALHADTPCMILTGNQSPCELVRAKAEKMEVPVICVREDIFSVIRSMSNLTSSKKIKDLEHIRLGIELVKENVCHERLIKALGI